MSVVRVGATKQYSDNWENIFSGGRSASGSKTKPGKKSAKSAKKSTKKTAKAAAGKKKKSKKK